MEAADRDFPPVRPLSAYPNRIPLSDIALQRLTQKGRLTPPDTAAIADILEVTSGTSTGSLICLLREHSAILCIHNTVSESFDVEANLLRKRFPTARIAIKDGFITGKPKKGGKPVIHVACPASIDFIGLSEYFESSFQSLLGSGDRFKLLKKLGKDLTTSGQYVLAGLCLDAALASAQPGSDAASTSAQPGDADLYVIRGQCYHKRGRFWEAIRSCDQALTIDKRHAAALYVKGLALAALKRYSEALVIFRAALPLTTDPEKKLVVLKYIVSVTGFQKQRKYGEYHVVKSSPDETYIEFISEALEIKATGDGRGRGVFLTRDVEAGELFMVTFPELDGPSVYAMQVQALRICGESRLARRVLSLLPDSDSGEAPPLPRIQDFDYDSEEEEEGDDGVIDVQRIKRVVELGSSRRSFKMRTAAHGESSSKQVFAQLSFINHSCLPNSSALTYHGLLFVRAAKSLKAGEEITISYIDCLQPLAYRARELGVGCSCERCEVEKRYRKVLADVPHVILRPEMKAGDVMIAAVSMVEGLETVLGKVASMTDEERGMIRAGYAEAYMVVAGKLLKFESLTKLELIDLMRKFVPGHEKSIALVCLLAMGYVFKFVWEKSFEQTLGDAMAALIGKVDLPSGDYFLIYEDLRDLVAPFEDGY